MHFLEEESYLIKGGVSFGFIFFDQVLTLSITGYIDVWWGGMSGSVISMTIVCSKVSTFSTTLPSK